MYIALFPFLIAGTNQISSSPQNTCSRFSLALGCPSLHLTFPNISPPFLGEILIEVLQWIGFGSAPPSNAHICRNQTPSGFEDDQVMRVEPPRMGLVPLHSRGPESLPVLFPPCEETVRKCLYKLESGLSPDSESPPGI